MDPRVLAVLGVLSAVNALLRGLSAGTAGRAGLPPDPVSGGSCPASGFVLGCTSLFASALMTAGVGPWLPYQMLVSASVGMGAGLLPRRVTGRAEIAMLVVYGVFAAYAFGLLMNLSGWPFVLGILAFGHADFAFVAGDPLRQPAPVRGVHAADVDGQLRHRPGDHELGGDHRARPGGADHAATGGPPATVTGVVADPRTGGPAPGPVGTTDRTDAASGPVATR